MVHNYRMHAMGVKKALKHMKRGLEHFVNNYTPIRKVVVTGQGGTTKTYR